MPQTLHIAIVGGGAAGFFAAITAKYKQPLAEVTIFERSTKVLAKVEITGGGRCNLTNTFETITNLKQVYPRGHQLMKRLFKQFGPQQTAQWFEKNNVPLMVQENHCVFPQSQDAHTIVNCLKDTAKHLGVKTQTGYCLTDIVPQPDSTLLLDFTVANGPTRKRSVRQMAFDRVAITTGGHPKIESFKSLARLGHNIEPPVPSLFTFNIADKAFTALTGTVVNPVGVSITGTKLKAEGSLLITHWGMSGPAVLRLSSLAARQLHENNYQLNMAINWIQLSNRTIIEQDVNEIIATNPQKQLANVCPYGLPSRLWLYLIRKMGFPTNRKWNELGKKGRNLLIETLTNDQYRINGKGTFKEEFVTCGGVSLSNIHQHTLESKVCPHLFLAGEVLDIDAVTGGFNLQAAWTTGYIVGQHIVE